jgi:hypothetical protein
LIMDLPNESFRTLKWVIITSHKIHLAVYSDSFLLCFLSYSVSQEDGSYALWLASWVFGVHSLGFGVGRVSIHPLPCLKEDFNDVN